MASELKVNKISPESGTTLTLGDSGDTINFGSGVLPNFENLTVTGDLTVDTNSLKVDSTNNFVGIGTATPSVALDVVGAITATGNITGTLATAAQPNITSVGTLSSLSVSGNITGTLATAAQPNITSLGTLTGLTTTGNINLGDNDKINLGATPTLELYSDGTNSWIKESGTGGLYIGGTNLNIMDSTFAEFLITGVTNGAVTLFYDNNSKLTTTSTGIDVTGTAVTDGLTVDGNVTLSGNLTVDTNTFFIDSVNNIVRIGDNSSYSPNTSADDLIVGTTTSGSKTGITILSSNDVAFSRGSIYFADSAANSIGRIEYNHGTSDTDVMKFFTNTAEAMRIDSSGNVGIGTSSPSAKLGVLNNIAIQRTSTYTQDWIAQISHLGSNTYGTLFLTPSLSHQTTAGFMIKDYADKNRFHIYGSGASTPETVFNENQGDYDFRVESSLNQNQIFLEGSSGHVGFGTNLSGVLSGQNQKVYIGGVTGDQPDNNALLVSGVKSNYANYPGLTLGQLHVYDSTQNTGGSGGAISFGADCGSGQETWIAAIDSNRASSTAGNYAGNLDIFTRPNGGVPVRAMRINSAQRVFINTTTDINSERVSIYAGSTEQALGLKVSNNNYSLIQGWDSSNNIRFTLTGSGELVHYQGGVIFNQNGSASDFRVESDTQTHMLFVDGTNNRVGIGTSSPGVALDVSGAIRATGDITAFYSSDITLKTNIENIQNPIDKVKQLNGVSYNWTKEAQEKYNHFTESKEIGVIAQEVEKVLPEIVAERDDGTKAVRYERMCALLIECVKDLQNQIDDLKKGN